MINAIVFVDPFCISDRSQGRRNLFQPSSSNLKGLFKAWGIKIQPEEIRKIYAVNRDGRLIYSFEREKEGERLLPVGPLKGKELNDSEVGRLERGISFLGLLDVADPKAKPSSLGVQGSRYVAYELFNGIRYKIFPGKSKRDGKDQYYVKISVDYHRPPPPREADSDKDKEKGHKERNKPASVEMKLKAQQLTNASTHGYSLYPGGMPGHLSQTSKDL